MNMTGQTDRVVRKQIEMLRQDGIPIISLRDGRGYKIAETEAELDFFLKNEYWAKIKTMMSTAQRMTGYFRDDGQLRFPGL